MGPERGHGPTANCQLDDRWALTPPPLAHFRPRYGPRAIPEMCEKDLVSLDRLAGFLGCGWEFIGSVLVWYLRRALTLEGINT